MRDLKKIAAERAARPKEKPVGSSFETEHQRAKRALVKQIDALDGSNIQMIAATTDEGNSEQKTLRVAAYCRVSTDDIDQAISIALQIREYKQKIKSQLETRRDLCGRWFLRHQHGAQAGLSKADGRRHGRED